MSIFDKFVDRATGLRMPALDERPIKLAIEDLSQEDYRDPRISIYSREKRVMYLSLEVVYWTTPETKNCARDTALRMLKSLMYSDVILALEEINYLVNNHDLQHTSIAIAALLTELRK